MNEIRTINNSLVPKRWGYEYPLYQNDEVAIWYLKIEHNKRTSFHCHPNKQTGLIILDGIAKIQLLNNSIIIKGLDKTSIFPRRFHSTEALSRNGVHILEVEAPPNKADLVRLRDDFGRENTGYEPEATFKPIPDHFPIIPANKVQHSLFFWDTHIYVYVVEEPEEFTGYDFETIFVFLSGGLLTETNEKIICPGDVVSSHNLDVLVQKFKLAKNTKVMEISKC